LSPDSSRSIQMIWSKDTQNWEDEKSIFQLFPVTRRQPARFEPVARA
jgi:hypothetical protein